MKPDTTIYAGDPCGREDASGEVRVTVDGKLLPLKPSLRVRNHSPTGFNWGYGGSGPAQLALALCMDFLGESPPEAPRSERVYQHVKFKLIAQLPVASPWSMTGEVLRAIIESVEKKDAEAAAPPPPPRHPPFSMSDPRTWPPAFIVQANDAVTLDKPPGRLTYPGLDRLQQIVGGYIELVYHLDGVADAIKRAGLLPYLMVVNEEGALRGLPPNKAASEIAGQPIVGDVLVIRSDVFEREEEDDGDD